MLLPLYAPHPAHYTPSVPSVSCMPVVMTIKAMLQSGIVLFDVHHKFDCHLYLKIRPTWSTRPLFLPLCTTIFLYGQRITEIIFGYSSASLSVYQDDVNDEGIVYSVANCFPEFITICKELVTFVHSSHKFIVPFQLYNYML